MIRPVPHVQAMAPYALAKMEAPPGASLLSLSQNESLRPPSPAAIAASSKALMDGALYPDPDWSELRENLLSHFMISAGEVLCGNGSLDLIGCIARTYSGSDRAVLAPEHAYPFFRSAAQMAGARFDTAPENGVTVSVDNLLGAVRPDTAIVFVANPGNPTGTRIPKSELYRLRSEMPDDVLLVIDEAYGEFADHIGESCFDMVAGTNTIVLRTFSKAYGLAGCRVGWGVFPEFIASEVQKVMNPNNIASASQVAAYAALSDQEYMRETCALTASIRDATAEQLRDVGINVFDSSTNFLLIDFFDAKAAQSADSFLRSKGAFLRPQSGAGLPHMLRMTVGSEEAMETVVDNLKNWREENTP